MSLEIGAIVGRTLRDQPAAQSGGGGTPVVSGITFNDGTTPVTFNDGTTVVTFNSGGPTP